MKRTIYTLAYRKKDGKWTVTKRGKKNPAATSSHKLVAMQRGVDLCKRNKPSQLIVKGRNGRIQSERTYKSDPRRTRG